MKKISLFIIINLILILNSYAQINRKIVPVLEPKFILSDFVIFLKYQENHIDYSNHIKAYDENSKPISIELFFQLLEKGDFLPLRIKTLDNEKVYQLYRLPNNTNKSIKSTIIYYSKVEHQYYKMIGKPFPEFDFQNLEGNSINNKKVKSKIIVYKTWFIHCLPCIQEIPDLNKIVANYKNRKDIIFLALALDKKADLVKFSKKNNFNYEIIPNQNNLIEEKLKLNSYPTHIIVNQFGNIVLVTNSAEKMEKRLSQITGYKKFENKLNIPQIKTNGLQLN